MNDIQVERMKVIGRTGYIYEKLCNSSGRLFKIKLLDEVSRTNFERKIEFSNLQTDPESVTSLILLTFLLLLITPAILLILDLISALAGLVIIVMGISLIVLFYYFPVMLAKNIAIKESADSILSILYMVVSLRSGSNLETAVKSTADNLPGPLGYAFKRMLWDVYMGKYTNVIDALSVYTKKWKYESAEFAEALELVISSETVVSEKRENMLNQALSTMLDKTEEKMKRYSESLRMPVLILNTMGILMPLLGMALFPIIVIFLTEAIKPISIILSYNVILPLIIYGMIKIVLLKRPWTFAQPKVSEHPEAVPSGKIKFKNTLIPLMPLAILVVVLVSGIGIAAYIFYPSSTNSLTNVFYTIIIAWGITLSISIFTYGGSYQNIHIIEDIKKIESELGFVLFKIGTAISKGIPLESAISTALKEKEFKSTLLFERINHNIRFFGFTLQKAVLDTQYGAIKYFPSAMTKSVMRVVSETSSKGLHVLSSTMMTMSTYLEKIRNVEDRLTEVLEESISSMSFQAVILTPVTSGIVLAMVFIIINYLMFVQQMFESIEVGGIGSAVNLSLGIIADINSIIPVELLQLVVGIYMIQTVYLISMFQSTLEYGEERVTMNYTIGKNLFIAMTIYSITFTLVSLLFQGFMGMMV